MTAVLTRDRRLTVEEFLRLEPQDDRRYELIDGRLIMMAPSARWHNTIMGNLVWLLRSHAARNQTRTVEPTGGIKLLDRDDTWFEADVVLAAEPSGKSEDWVDRPLLVAEVLSPFTLHKDRHEKLPEYRRLPTLQDILLIEPDKVLVEHHTRIGTAADAGWTVRVTTDIEAPLFIGSISGTIRLQDLYAGVPVT